MAGRPDRSHLQARQEGVTMTTEGYRHYILIIDRSGSMTAIRQETETGIRAYIEGQAAIGGKTTLSLWQFDTGPGSISFTPSIERVINFADMASAPEYILRPRGYTPLLDAIGTAVTQEGEDLAALPETERPGKVLVLIATDGLENSSREWTKDRVKNLLTRQQEKFSWQISYIGANQDAFAEAGNMGIASANTSTYRPTRGSTQSVWGTTTRAAARYASGQSAHAGYTPEEQEQNEK
jgi:hypothetical protein